MTAKAVCDARTELVRSMATQTCTGTQHACALEGAVVNALRPCKLPNSWSWSGMAEMFLYGALLQQGFIAKAMKKKNTPTKRGRAVRAIQPENPFGNFQIQYRR
jgi:hypothetical protein